jgi:hypothetical protein
MDGEKAGPSTITLRASAKVSPISAMRREALRAKSGSPSAMPRTHSAPVRVLPAPRPPSMSQVVQGARSRARPGRRCSGRQRIGQCRRTCSKSSSHQDAVASASLLFRDNPVKMVSKFVAQLVEAAPWFVVVVPVSSSGEPSCPSRARAAASVLA